MAKNQNLEESVNSIIDIAMNRLKEIIDVNTIIGKPISTANKTTILPVSKVSVGFVAGGGEIVARAKKCPNDPFAGGSGSGFVLTPLGFLVIDDNGVKYVNCETKTPLDEVIKFSNNLVTKMINDKKGLQDEKGN